MTWCSFERKFLIPTADLSKESFDKMSVKDKGHTSNKS